MNGDKNKKLVDVNSLIDATPKEVDVNSLIDDNVKKKALPNPLPKNQLGMVANPFLIFYRGLHRLLKKLIYPR